MSFDGLAAHYHWMEGVFAGSLMQRCRATFLSHTKDCRSALLVGEGTGRFLVALLSLNPQIKITCVEHSERMIKLVRQRLIQKGLDDSQIQFQHVDVLHWTPPTKKFDLIVTHFFLDCFRAEQLQKLIPLLAGSATDEAIWLLADFRVPERGWCRWRAKVILALLYAFFKFMTSLPASSLTSPDNLLSDAGFKLVDRQLADFGFVHSDLWERNHVVCG